MLNWGILGTSFISETMARAISEDVGSNVQAIAGRKIDHVERFSREFSIRNSYTNYQELINDPSVDIVYIGLPNHLHSQYAIDCALAGKHILCEKSLSIDMKSSYAMAEHIKAERVFFAEGLMYLSHPVIAQLIVLLKDNIIGEIKSISGQYCANIAQFVNPESKGAIFNLGCYPVSLLHLILQSYYGKEVWSKFYIDGVGSISDKDGNICDASMLLSLDNGVTARIQAAETYGMLADFTITGTTGYLRFKTNPWLPDRYNAIDHFNFNEECSKEIVIDADNNAFNYQVRNIRNAIEKGQKQLTRPAASINDSVDIMTILSNWHSSILEKHC